MPLEKMKSNCLSTSSKIAYRLTRLSSCYWPIRWNYAFRGPVLASLWRLLRA